MEDRNGFRYVQNMNNLQKLILPSTFNNEGKNLLELAIAKAHAATSYEGIEKGMQALTDKFEYQSFSQLVKVQVGSCNICQRRKYSQKGPIGYVILLRVPVGPWSNITKNFLKLSPVFTKCSVSWPNIPVGENHIVRIL